MLDINHVNGALNIAQRSQIIACRRQYTGYNCQVPYLELTFIRCVAKFVQDCICVIFSIVNVEAVRFIVLYLVY